MEFAPPSMEKTAASFALSDSRLSRMLLALMLAEAFFMVNTSVKGSPAYTSSGSV